MGSPLAAAVVTRRVALLLPLAAVPLVTVAALAVWGGESSTAAGGTGVFGPVDANGWAWPSDTRGVTQEFHDGFSIDLASTPGGPLFAPYDGEVVKVGFDGGTVPGVCVANPGWWRGPNQTVIMRHVLPSGQTIYSSHNHIAEGSSAASGIQVGSRVAAGQQVASAGMSGCTAGPHTHFTLTTRARNTNADVNPGPFLGPPCPS